MPCRYLLDRKFGPLLVTRLLRDSRKTRRHLYQCECVKCGTECRRTGHTLLRRDSANQCHACCSINKRENLVTPDEIEASCKAIQATWTPEEEQRRRAGSNKRVSWDVPSTRVTLDD